MKRVGYFLCGLLGICLPGLSAALTIDLLTDQQQLECTAALPSAASYLSGVSAIGGTRKFRVNLVPPVPAGLAKVSLEADSGFLLHSQGPGVLGQSTIVWDGSSNPSVTNSAGLPAVNFLQDQGTQIMVQSFSFDLSSWVLSLKVYDASDVTGNTYSIASKVINSSHMGGVSFRFAGGPSDFLVAGPLGPVDFTRVGALELAVDGSAVPALDAVVGPIKTDGICDLLPDANGKVIDLCGVCGGDNSSCSGCDGVPFSGLEFDECGVCGGDNSSCAGCDGIPYSGLVFDQCGVCGGNDSSCSGCDGIPNSGLTFDACGVCGGDNSSCAGCDGVPFSGKSIDLCGQCGGDSSSCKDCAGVPNGSLSLDQCGVCGGDGKTCVKCSGQDISEVQAELDGLAKAQEFVVRGATSLLAKAGKAAGKNFSAYIAKTKDAAHKLQLSNWILSWSMPSIISSCENAVACVTISNENTLNIYRTQAAQLRKLALVTLAKVKKLGGIPNKGKISSYLASAEKTYGAAIALSKTVPLTSTECD